MSDVRVIAGSYRDPLAVLREHPLIGRIEAKMAKAAAQAAAEAMAAASRALGRLDRQPIDAVVVAAITNGRQLHLDTVGQPPGSAVAASPCPAHAPPAPRVGVAA